MTTATVLHIVSGLSTGGAELSLLRLMESTPELRPGGVISLRDAGSVGPRLAALGVAVEAVGIRGSLPTPGQLLRLRRLARAAKPGIVQGWMYHGNLAALGCRTAAGRTVPVVWNIRHSVYSLADERPWTALVIRLGARLSRQPARIIYNSRTAAAQHEALGYAPERTLVIPNGFDIARFRPDPAARSLFRRELGLGAETVLVGLVGRYHPMKDHRSFLGAARVVAAAHPGVQFVLAGSRVDRSNAELQALVGESGIADRVHLLGEREDTPRLMAALDVLCSSSVSEGFPNVLGEAMSCGIPCVTTDVGDSAWLVGEGGTVVPRRDPAAMAAGVGELVAMSPDGRRAVGARGRARIEGHFALPAVARQYLELYRGLAPGQAGR